MKKSIPWKLILARLKKETDEQSDRMFEQWMLNADNRLLFAELQDVWNKVREESGEYNPDLSYYWNEMQQKMHRSAKKQYTFSFSYLRLAGMVALLFILVTIGLSYYLGAEFNRETPKALTYLSMSGKSKVILPDSSEVWLNNGTTLTYYSAFEKSREVKLTGEAFFSVTKDPDKPFIVYTSDVCTKVYGTKFNINAYPENKDVKIALLEGSVSVFKNNCKEEKYMIPGQVASYCKSSHELTFLKDDVNFESFWANSSITFEAKPLEYIVRYLEKWYHVDILLDPTLSSSQAYTFTIKEEPLEVILRIMASINPISYSFDKNNVVTIKNVEPLK
ncbi:MAG: FecR family protein [Parabacteroides sp.]|jgi:transmembrane sensor|nr:FecR family protein [Parabacteroides sp.]MBP9480871.1 FecR family protein [Parabacteroides sp.]MBP9580033.1 FecR family protein [Parabacteroides sp.]MDD2417285.1 FecR family protein [Parabacteroides sp.]